MNDKEFIKRFNDISISNICKKLGYNSQNIYTGKASNDKILLVRNIIEYEIKKLLLDLEYKYFIDLYESKQIEVLEDDENES